MSRELFEKLYSGLASGVTSPEKISLARSGGGWAVVKAGEHCGIAMDTFGNTLAPMLPKELGGLSLQTAASAVGSWNLSEASLALAAANCALNTPERIMSLKASCTREAHHTNGLELAGKTVGFVGHLKGADTLHKTAKRVIILEREPKPGDYPDPAAELLLPECDVVFITGSAIINKTLPRLIELTENAVTVLTGPSVPLWEGFFDFGIDVIAGLAITDAASAAECALSDKRCSPYPWGIPFQLNK